MSRGFQYTILTLTAVCVMFCLGLTFPIEFMVYLGLGWVFYLVRVVPEVKIEWGGVGLAVVCLVLLAGLTHSFLGWIYRATRWTEDNPGRWEVRWTASILGVVLLMFVAGISATGIAHQTGWLLTSKERWISGFPMNAGQRTQSMNNLKQIGLALTNYEAFEGSLPQAATIDAEGRLMHGWQTRILRFADQPELYQRIDLTRPWDDPKNASAFRTPVQTYLNPGIREKADPNGPAPSHYSGNVLVLGGDLARKLNQFPDGTANTMIAGEVPGNFKPWGHPANWRNPALGINQSPEGFGGPYPGGANFLFADGSVRFIKNSIAPKVFRAISTPDGGETVSSDAY